MKKLHFLPILLCLLLFSCSNESEGLKAGKELCACLEKVNGNRKAFAECQTSFDSKNANKLGDSKFGEVVRKEAMECMTKAKNSLTFKSSDKNYNSENNGKPKISEEKDTNISDEAVTENEGENWDLFLVEYEEYVDSYIKLLKKVSKGDQSAILEYQALLETAQELEKTLTEGKNENNLSSKQINKMMKIQGKMIKAASELH